MKLAGQAERTREHQRGYAMAALLVAMSIMAVMMTVVMPVWKHEAQRERETELIFRGQQYVHAIGLFQRKYANAYPPNIDALVEQRFLRKKFKDPITNDDFALIGVAQGAAAPGQQAAGQRGGAATAGRGGQTPTAGRGQPAAPTTGARGISPIGTPSSGAGTTGGLSGVSSKSKDQSIRLYNGRSHYNEWAFVYTPQIQAPGAGGAPGTATPGTTAPGQRGQPGQPQPTNPFGSGVGGQRGRGNPNGPGTGRPGGPGTPNGPGGGRGFGPGPSPMQPIFPPRGRF